MSTSHTIARTNKDANIAQRSIARSNAQLARSKRSGDATHAKIIIKRLIQNASRDRRKNERSRQRSELDQFITQ